jgi:hypothetical protein
MFQDACSERNRFSDSRLIITLIESGFVNCENIIPATSQCFMTVTGVLLARIAHETSQQPRPMLTSPN